MLCRTVADLPLDDWREEYRAMHRTVGSLMAVLTAHAPVRRLRGFAAASALMTISTGLAGGFTLVSLRLGASSRAEASNIRTELPASIQLAQAFTAALNAHDVDALVELFTEEHAGPTVTADRFAWQKFEIRCGLSSRSRAVSGRRLTTISSLSTEPRGTRTCTATTGRRLECEPYAFRIRSRCTTAN
jgi:hypothetical protein